MSLSNYTRPRGMRVEARNLTGRLRGGKLMPLKAVAVRESESGVISQDIMVEAEAIAGRMLTPITAQLHMVYVPAQAADALKNPEDAYPGNAEVFRQKLLSGNPVFGLEEEAELSKRMGVEPRSIAGTKKVNEVVRLAHNAAVNHLRRRKYVNATLLDANSTAITPALLGQTVLDRLNAVLDPEDRVNGMVELDLQGNLDLPVKSTRTEQAHIPSHPMFPTAPDNSVVPFDAEGNYDFTGEIWADGTGLTAGGISLTDIYNAETVDRITRNMRKMVDDNPVHGEEMVARAAHGLTVDPGKEPFVMYERSFILGMEPQLAMDGPSLGQVNTNSMAQFSVSVPVPRTEFGGVVVTFLSVKPDETMEHQPHPILSDTWTARNYVADELALDPVPVTVRDLYADCDVGDEETIVCYNGNNHLLRRYQNYGFNRALDTTTVENKTALWQLQVPLSVTPDSVIYPEELDHYPFALNGPTDEPFIYSCNTVARINTPIIFGPTPVEELAVLETEDIFEDAEE